MPPSFGDLFRNAISRIRGQRGTSGETPESTPTPTPEGPQEPQQPRGFAAIFRAAVDALRGDRQTPPEHPVDLVGPVLPEQPGDRGDEFETLGVPFRRQGDGYYYAQAPFQPRVCVRRNYRRTFPTVEDAVRYVRPEVGAAPPSEYTGIKGRDREWEVYVGDPGAVL